ncbi:MAG: molybdopterin molybdotransferase MoeA [Chloroflexota bacterium]|nr:molybdopterin molybdotransferase MoeA [Chloroflexota bacterium]
MPEPNTPLAERPWEDVERMVGVDEALARVLDAVAPLPTEEVPLLDALGLTLAESVVAEADVPPFRNSAMDGYAVRAGDTAGAAFDRPIRLRVVGQIAAGQPVELALDAGTAARIMTGASVPTGADAVVRFEETDEGSDGRAGPKESRRGTVAIHRAAKPGDNVREAGEDLRAGTTVLASGTRLRPAEIGLLAATNRATAPVHRRPRVAILSTGDEVVDVGPPLRPGQIRNSNGSTLAAMVRQWGAVPVPLGIARDTVEDLSEKLAAARDADLIVTSGGVSLGDFDLVKDVLRAEGEVAIWQVRMKPGKPLAFGRVGGRPLLGLPGNPVAAAVSFFLFGRPAILKMLGRRDLTAPAVEATLLEPLDNRGQRRHYVRARLERRSDGTLTVRTAGEQGAGVLSSLGRANGLLVVPESLERAEPGMRLPVLLLDGEGDVPFSP